MELIAEFKDPIIFLFTGKAQHGKDTSAAFLKDYFINNDKKVIFSQYSKYIKFYAKEMTNWDGSEETKPRELLQQLGTKVIRQQLNKSEMFIQRQIDDILIYSYFYDAIIVSDIRLPREIEGIKEHYKKVITINVFRPNFDNGLTEKQKKHITETALDDYDDYDYRIINTTIDKLKEDIHDIYIKEMIKYEKND